MALSGTGRRVLASAAGALLVAAQIASNTVSAQEAACAKADFEAAVDDAAAALRDLNNKNRPAFQEKLRTLKEKRGWSHDQFITEAAPFVRDDQIAVFDKQSEELLTAISTMGQQGTVTAAPDCSLLAELRARMKVLVETQTAKWVYMFEKLEKELWK